MSRTNYFYDCEFKEDGSTIDLISIGVVCEDGREFYAVSNEFDTRRVAKDNWLMANVMNSIDHDQTVVDQAEGFPLVRDIFVTDPAAMSRKDIRDGIYNFLREGKHKPDLWAWYSAYDHVCLAQLFGPMVDMPNSVPFWTNDIKTLHMAAGRPALPVQPGGNHNALDDARHNVVRYNYLKEFMNEKLGNSEVS